MQTIFKFYCGLPANLEKARQAVRAHFKNKRDGDLHVTIFHFTRRRISTAKQTEAAKGRTSVSVPTYTDEGYNCFVGTGVVGASTRGKILKQVRYVVTAITYDKITLHDELTEVEFATTPHEIASSSRLEWACTYNATQGRTEEGTVILHDLDSRFLTRAHLFVGISRVMHGDNVFLAE